MLDELVELSNRYGKDPAFVLAGGGNTSYKDGDTLYVKGSGTSLATIAAEDFVSMDRAKLSRMLQQNYPSGDDAREAAALTDLMAARRPGNGEKRPSVETLLHNLFPFRFVLHVHPALVNGLTCSRDAEEGARRLLGDGFVWIPIYRPGYALSVLCSQKLEEYRGRTGEPAQILLLQNHGIFVAADTVAEIDALMDRVTDVLSAHAAKTPDLSPAASDPQQTEEIARRIAALYEAPVRIDFAVNRQIFEFLSTPDAFAPLDGAFTPDHIVYCKARFLYAEQADDLPGRMERFLQENGYPPKVVCVRNVGAFFAAVTERELANARLLFLDAVNVAVYARNFGGPLHMTPELVHFILNWEMEAYRQKVAAK